MGNNVSYNSNNEDIDFIGEIEEVQLAEFNTTNKIDVVNQKDMNRLVHINFKSNLESNKNGFLWFSAKSIEFEKNKEKVLIIFYGKLVLEKLSINDIKLKTYHNYDTVYIYVVNEKSNFIIVNK